MLQEAESLPTFSRKSETMFTLMYPEECTLSKSIAASCNIGKRDSHSGTSGEEELNDSEDENQCQ